MAKEAEDKKARRLLAKFESAAVELAFMGSFHPDEWPRIGLRYTRAKAALLKHMDAQAARLAGVA